MLYISSDYVFDGDQDMEEGSGYLPESPMNPQTTYGLIKKAEEETVLSGSKCDKKRSRRKKD